MKQELLNTMREKAKTKKDGVYSTKKHFYLVFKNQVAGYCDYFGNFYEIAYGFSITKGKAEGRYKGREILKSYLKKLT